MSFTLLMQHMLNRRRRGLRENRNGQSNIDLTQQHRDRQKAIYGATVTIPHELGHRPLKYDGRGYNSTTTASAMYHGP